MPLIYIAKMFYSTLEILVKEVVYFHRILLKNNYTDWMIKELEKKALVPIINPNIGLEV